MIGTLNIASTDAEAVPVSITVNGQVHQVTVPVHRVLVDFLRDDLHLTGTKLGCDSGQCGACYRPSRRRGGQGVHGARGAGRRRRSDDHRGMATGGALTKVQTALWEEHGVQCGYCTPAMVLTMTDLLNTNPHPKRARDPGVHGRDHLPLRRLPERRARRPDAHLTCFQGRPSSWPLQFWVRRSSAAKIPSSFAASRNTQRTSRLPGTTYVAILHSPHPHARIKSLDTSAAQAMPGVVQVFTGADLAGKMMPMVCIWKPAGVESHFGPHPYGLPGSQTALATDKVRYVGEWVAAVVAETREQAYAALPAIKVDYEVLPSVSRAEDALKPGAPQLHDTVPGNLCAHVEYGDKAATEQAIRDAEVKVHLDITIPRQLHQPLETRATMAQVRSRLRRVHALHQHADPARQQVHDLQPGDGLPYNKLRVIVPRDWRLTWLERLSLPGRAADAAS